MVDGKAVDMTMAMIPFHSPSRQGAETLVPELGFVMAAAYRDVLWKSGYPPCVFRPEGLSSSEGVSEVAPPPAGAARSLPRQGVMWCPPGSSPLGLRGSGSSSDIK